MLLFSRRAKLAFSLVELSIVLVILGLLVGGVLSGKSLIRAAELRTVTSDFVRYKTAMLTFRDKYFALPGDMNNAVKFWGAQAGATTDGVDNTCADLLVPSTGTATCNGDGSGFIADTKDYLGPPTVGRLQYYETYRAWQQLANAGLIEGRYTGNINNTALNRYTLHQQPGVNAPAAKIQSGAGWRIWSLLQKYDAWAEWFETPAGNYITVGASGTATGTLYQGDGPLFKPEEAWNIDTKIDDGKSGKGFIRSFPGTGTVNPNCTVDGSADTNYTLTNSSIACTLFIGLGL
jgi:prepilin-type N-terminal cleavage/methylation domain-containing protein